MNEENKIVVGALHVVRARYVTNLNVKHPSGIVNSISIESDAPLGDMHECERVTISCNGFPEYRMTAGIVRKVSHVLHGGPRDFYHTINVDLDEVDF